MVPFWPWRANDSSPASFEKTLSNLSNRITKTQARLDSLRTSSRRARLVSTLYLSFAYLVYAIVLLLVIGYNNLGPYEWSGVAGGPVLIYLVRTSLNAYYNFRIDSHAARLKEYQAERAKTIQKLKDATKYDSTLELIEKYGGEKPKPTDDKDGQKNKNGSDGPFPPGKNSQRQALPGRTTTGPPPPTANIQPRPSSSSGLINSDSQTTAPGHIHPSSHHSQHHHVTSREVYAPAHSEPHWYDRILDVLLGDDETSPKNRIVLLCSSCRLVNGQAAPGTRTLQELGPWRCMGCGAANNEAPPPPDDDAQKLVRDALADARGDSDVEGEVEAEPLPIPEGEQDAPGAMRRRKGRGKGGK